MRTITLALVFASAAAAQQPLAIRQLGRIDRISTDSLSSIAAALPMQGGRVLVNDITAHRVLLFDSTLSHPIVIADTSSATANAYGRTPGTIIHYRGDSALFIDPSSLSMLVIGPTGKVERVMAVPRPRESGSLIGSIFGTPGFDARGRLVSFSGQLRQSVHVIRRGAHVTADPASASDFTQHLDSAFIVRTDLATRALDTIASVKIPKLTGSFRADAEGLLLAIESTPDPLPLVDDWAVMPDGSIAIVRGRDYHVDWLGADGHWSSSAKMSFDWKRVDDARKQVLIDSATAALQATLDELTRVANGGGGGAQGGRLSAPAGGAPGALSGVGACRTSRNGRLLAISRTMCRRSRGERSIRTPTATCGFLHRRS